MLADFQQALADLTADPAWCRAVRQRPALLEGRYTLTPPEAARLEGIVRHPGMVAACRVYRMNRVAPLAVNLRETCRALGPALTAVIEAYWRAHPHGIAHFQREAMRFADFVAAWLREPAAGGVAAGPPVGEAAARLHRLLAEERAAAAAAFAASWRAGGG
jgi:hypothetical protein